MTEPFIDLHTHISLTDPHGVCGEAACQQVLLAAREVNVHTLAITPHSDIYLPASNWQPDLEQTVAACHRLAPEVQVLSGCEFLLRQLSDVLPVQRGQVPTINHSKYLLIEFLPDARSSFLEECVHELKIMGYIPVIAHPERYLSYQRSPEKLRNLISSGALLQGTLAALLGVHGSHARQTLLEMLKADLIHSLASDFHGGDYAQVIRDSVSLLTKQFGAAKPQAWLSANPARILAGAR